MLPLHLITTLTLGTQLPELFQHQSHQVRSKNLLALELSRDPPSTHNPTLTATVEGSNLFLLSILIHWWGPLHYRIDSQ